MAGVAHGHDVAAGGVGNRQQLAERVAAFVELPAVRIGDAGAAAVVEGAGNDLAALVFADGISDGIMSEGEDGRITRGKLLVTT